MCRLRAMRERTSMAAVFMCFNIGVSTMSGDGDAVHVCQHVHSGHVQENDEADVEHEGCYN
jgi:hypothetical protein